MTATKNRATGDDAQRILIAGTTGSGKTTLAVQLAEQAEPCVWIDLKRKNDPARIGSLPCRPTHRIGCQTAV